MKSLKKILAALLSVSFSISAFADTPQADIQKLVANKLVEVQQKKTALENKRVALENLKKELNAVKRNRRDRLEDALTLGALATLTWVITYRLSASAMKANAEDLAVFLFLGGGAGGLAFALPGIGNGHQAYLSNQKARELSALVGEVLEEIRLAEKSLAEDMQILRQFNVPAEQQ